MAKIAKNHGYMGKPALKKARFWISHPEPAISKNLHRLILQESRGWPLPLCLFSILDPPTIIKAIEADPSPDATSEITAAGFASISPDAASPGVEIWRTEDEKLELKITDALVRLTNGKNHLFFHIDRIREGEFPIWLKFEWRARAISAALAIAAAIRTTPDKILPRVP